MVTVIHKHIDLGYYSDDWIEDGITCDAVMICNIRWERDKKTYKIAIRNRNHEQIIIKPLNRW